MSSPQEKLGIRHLVVVCLLDHPKVMTLLRTASKRAADVAGRWRAVYIETPDHSGPVHEGVRQRMMRMLTVAEQMGAEIRHIHAGSIKKGVDEILHEDGSQLTLLVTGNGRDLSSRRKNLSEWDVAIRHARMRRVAVEVIPLFESNYQQTLGDRLRWIKFNHVLYALMAVAIAFGITAMLEHYLPPALFRINSQNIGLLFMIACAFSAGRFGLLPGLVASGTGFLILNYYFTVPYHTFKLTHLTDTLNIFLFLSAAIVISLFTSQTRKHAEKAAKRELNTQALFTLYRLGANASSRKQALEELQQKLTRMLMMEVAFFLLPEHASDAAESTYPDGIALTGIDKEALALCRREMKTVGISSPFYSKSSWRFEPMIAPGGEVGILGVKPKRKGQIDAWFGRLLTAISDQTASILEHIELGRSMEETRMREEREKLRSMLLSCVSHDLKTPLASIIGALSIYRSQGKKLTPEKQEMLIDTALEESERLDSFITNILDMTHLESGKIEFRQEWGEMHSLIRHVIKRLDNRLRLHRVTVQPPLKNIEVMMDMMMVEQVLQNVLDNACKYTPAGTEIEITCDAVEGNGFYCEVHDHGAGLPPEKLNRVFDKYARLQKQDSQVAGTGLGLAICKAMMEAQGGSITASNHQSGGAVFTLNFPQWRKVDTTKYVA